MHKALTTGNCERLPRANTIPRGKAKTIPIPPNKRVKKAPPHLCVGIWCNPKVSFPDKRKKQ